MTDWDAAPALTLIAALIAATLYLSSYFYFVRLLRYPRNWHRPNLPACLAAGFPAAAAVLLVSFSSQGLDAAALAVSLGFFGAMGYLIAAPAIAFLPAARPTEFLARHGDRAGLWLVVLALGLAQLAAISSVPNSKLLALLAAAGVVELAWFWHHHWAIWRRPLHALEPQDLAVLKTQAKGEIVDFQRLHRIDELVLSGGLVHWRGCGKGTPPCPFNFYVNHLGLNTAPCCREHLRELCHFIAACLREMGVVHWLEGGSLLGAVREDGALLAWEDDVDISVLLDADMTWERLVDGLAERGARAGYYVDPFEPFGFLTISFDAPRPWPFRWQRNRWRGEIRADIATYRQATSGGRAVLERQNHKGDMPATENGRYGVPREIVLPTSTINLLGRDIACPNEPEAYLRILYGAYEAVEYTYLNPVAAATRQQADAANQDADNQEGANQQARNQNLEVEMP